MDYDRNQRNNIIHKSHTNISWDNPNQALDVYDKNFNPLKE